MATEPNPWSFGTTQASQTETISYDQGLRQYMPGHLQLHDLSTAPLTAIVAYFAANTPAVMSDVRVGRSGRVGLSGLGWIAALAPLAFVMFFSFRLQAMSFATAQGVFWGYAAVMGLSLSSLLLVYTGTSIARSFFVTAIVFGSMSLYGYATKRDLTGMGSFLMMGLWGIILASLVNMFLHSAGMEFILSILCVIVFTGLTAYDTQNLKAMYYQVQGADRDTVGKTALLGALRLYLDFINLFITMLRLFGDRR